jgi:ABC-type sugar transport system ATPase subunit
LGDAGVGVVFISHNLEHVMHIADRVVVLRQGSYIGECTSAPEFHSEIVSMIVGSQTAGAGDATGPRLAAPHPSP